VVKGKGEGGEISLVENLNRSVWVNTFWVWWGHGCVVAVWGGVGGGGFAMRMEVWVNRITVWASATDNGRKFRNLVFIRAEYYCKKV